MDYFVNGIFSNTIQALLIKLFIIYTTFIVQLVNCRLLLYPPSLSDSSASINLQSCGGAQELILSAGRCGVCGNAWQSDEFRLIDNIFLPAALLKSDDYAKIQIRMNDYRDGWLEVRICNVASLNEILKQDCFDRNILNIVDSNMTRKYLKPTDILNNLLEMIVHIPAYLTCQHCVLQLKYKTYDQIGPEPVGSDQCQDCDIQETFQDCSLITIYQPQISENHVTNNAKQMNIYQADETNRMYSRHVNNQYNSNRRQISKRNENEPMNMLSSSSPKWLTPRMSQKSSDAEKDLVCMSRGEYNNFRKTVDMLEYYLHTLKHESLRDTTVFLHQPDLNNQNDDIREDRNCYHCGVPNYERKLRASNDFKLPNKYLLSRKIRKNKRLKSLSSAKQRFHDCKAIGIFKGNIKADRFCESNCRRGMCNRRSCQCKRS